MSFAYAIMAHNAPDQLAALIDRLAGGADDDRIILHLDKRSTLWREQRDRFAGHPSGKVELIDNPVAVIWGHHSQVVAQLRMLERALERDFDYYHLISGADWPIAARHKIERDIRSYGEIRPAFVRMWNEEQPERMQDWWFERRTPKWRRWPRLAENIGRAQVRLSWSLSAMAHRIGLTRSTYMGQPWMKGSSWYSLPRDIASDARSEMARLAKNGRLLFTQCADEHVIPSIVGRRHGSRLAPDRRYIDWSAGGYHPKLLTRADRTAIAASGAWFARKFDMTADDFFLDPEAFALRDEAAE